MNVIIAIAKHQNQIDLKVCGIISSQNIPSRDGEMDTVRLATRRISVTNMMLHISDIPTRTAAHMLEYIHMYIYIYIYT